jgi:LysR family transcriptional regulator, cell division regulator
LNIDALRVFKAVAETESVSRAARTLNCVPSNVTARIRGLEGELGVKLFFRKPRGMALTPSGATLLDYARRAVDLLSEAKAALASETGSVGPLSIGATESVAVNRLPEILIDYGRAHPDVELSLRVATSEELVGMVLDNAIEAAFVSKFEEHPRLESVAVFTEELYVVSSKQVATLTEAACEAVVVQRSGCAYRDALERWLQQQGITARRKLELPAPEVALACVASGMGIAVMPFATLSRLGALGKVMLHELPPDLRQVTISLVRDKRFPPTPSFTAFQALCLTS